MNKVIRFWFKHTDLIFACFLVGTIWFFVHLFYSHYLGFAWYKSLVLVCCPLFWPTSMLGVFLYESLNALFKLYVEKLQRNYDASQPKFRTYPYRETT